MKTKNLSLFFLIFVLLSSSGCSTTSSKPISTNQTREAIIYAEKVIGRKTPLPVEWHLMPVKEKINGVWAHSNAGARTQYFANKTRIVVYVGPKYESQPQFVYDHEAGHAVLRQAYHDPKWKNYFKNWQD